MNYSGRWQAGILALTSLTACGLYIFKALDRMSDDESGLPGHVLAVGSLLLFAACTIKQAHTPLLQK